MNGRGRAAVNASKKRRRNTILITLAIVVAVIAMIYFERIAELYVISTLAVVALLTVVAFSDIERTKRVEAGPAPLDDSAALGSGISAAAQGGRAQTARAARGRR